MEDFERLKNVINETFKWGSYDSVLFISDDESGVEFESFGMLADMAIMHQTQKGYYLYESSDGRRFLAPSSESYRRPSTIKTSSGLFSIFAEEEN